MAGERYQHIFLTDAAETQAFRNPGGGGGDRPRIPERDRTAHSDYLRRQFEQAWREAEERRTVAHTERRGVYLEFRGEVNADLPVQSLEQRTSGIRLLNTHSVEGENGGEIRATVYVPNEKRGNFLRKVRRYAEEENSENGRPKEEKLMNCLSDVRHAMLTSFWQDSAELLPVDTPDWVEVWLAVYGDGEGGSNGVLADSFLTALERHGMERKAGELHFPERQVVLVRANRTQLEALIEECDSIAELRLAKEVPLFFIEMENAEQVEWAAELLERCRFDDLADVSVCILDTGINNGHMLLAPVLADDDLHTVDPTWGRHDHEGHGTLMAGCAVYGDLADALQSPEAFTIRHRLESVKILPSDGGQNSKELWGYLTSQGISRVEIQRPESKRIACMAVTSSDDRDRGRPTSWSGALDTITSGAEDGDKRLVIVSAGNVAGPGEWRNYPEANLTNEIHDPAQAWNALTVGAFTRKTQIEASSLSSYTPLASSGELSPFSTTSYTWDNRTWPIKPEVVFEGGNVACGPNDSVQQADDLQLLSTFHDPQVAQFAPFNATSAAAAQAARMAARIQADYPEAWPETIRALMVHSAEWPAALKEQFAPGATNKTDLCRLLRICGYGEPNLERALFCSASSLTLISEAVLQPYDKQSGRYVTRDLHLYRLPWPEDVLRDLGEANVQMRVTLSYFVEPGPGEIGWTDRYRYPSHGLRFDLISPTEDEAQFQARVNRLARGEDGQAPGTKSPSAHWMFGEGRNLGSIHSDVWTGTASELADSNRIAIFPVVGWWKERNHLGRWGKTCRYSLVVSITSPNVDVDIYTPVAAKVGITVPVEISV